MSNFVPGYSVASTLEDILTQKRLDKRQDASDLLNQQNVQSEIASRAEQADTNKMYRQAYSDQRAANIAETQRKAQVDQNESKALSDFQTTPEFGQWDPKYQSAYKVALASGDHQTVRTIISKMLTPDKAATTRTGGYIWTSDRKGNPINTGQWMEGVQGDQFHEQPAPVQENAANSPQVYNIQKPDPNDPTKQITESHFMAPQEFKQYLAKNGQQDGSMLFKGNIPAQKNQNPIGPVDASTLNQLATARSKATGGWFGNAAGLSKYRALQSGAIANWKTRTPPPNFENVKRIAQLAIASQDDTTPTDEILKGVIAQGHLSPEDAPTFETMLRTVRGN